MDSHHIDLIGPEQDHGTPARPSDPPLPGNAGAPDSRAAHRGVLTASSVAACFGIAWAWWGASGLPADVQATVRAVGVVVGTVIIGRSWRLRRTAPAVARSMLRSRTYRRVVALEGAAIGAGGAVLTLTGRSEYVAAWVAAVVGVHFLAFGTFIARFYYPLGAVVTAGGVSGAVVGAAGGGSSGVKATSGLVAGAALLAASGYRTVHPGSRTVADAYGEGASSLERSKSSTSRTVRDITESGRGPRQEANVFAFTESIEVTAPREAAWELLRDVRDWWPPPADGRIVVTDLFYADGPNLYATAWSEPISWSRASQSPNADS